MAPLIVLLFFLFWLWALVRLFTVRREPSSTIAWILFVTSVPLFGPVLFLIFGRQRLVYRAAKREKKLLHSLSTNASLTPPPGSSIPPSPLHSEDSNVLRLANIISGYEVTEGNTVEIFTDPSKTLCAMKEAIQKAKNFIHLEYYIIASDEVTEELFSDLMEASDKGVKIRILYDSLGSLSLKRLYFRKLTQKGIFTAGFLPFSFWPQHMNPNFRNHRKILVVDGNLAFTGGANIGKQYLGRLWDNQWHDIMVKVSGPVCRQLEDVFAKDWYFTTKENLLLPEYLPEAPKKGESIIQVLESGPNTQFHTLHQAIFLALNSAQKEIFLSTPYFIPDPSIQACLTVAALRGVKVQLLLPAKTDSKMVQFASRSFYEDLLATGVQIFEYQPRILHSKLLVTDDKWTMIGSSNMDIRSFRLNFELNLLIFGSSVAKQAIDLFKKDLADSHSIQLDVFRRRPLGKQLLENACRLLSPVL